MKRTTILFCVFLVLIPVAGYSIDSLDVYGGLLWIGNPTYAPASPDGLPTGAPSPILNTWSVSLPLRMGRIFRLVPEIGLFGTQYGLIPGYDKTVPVEREYADAVWFLGAMVDLDLWMNIPLGQRLDLGIQAGATFLGRIPVQGWGDGWDQLDEMNSYFFAQARYLYPEVGITFGWRPEGFDRLGVTVKAMTYLPIFHLWDNEEVGFADQFMASVSIGLRFFSAPRQTAVEVGGATDGSGDSGGQSS